jgi:hypothetical protein
MRLWKLLALLALVLAASNTHADERLLGKWKSSLPLTREFYLSHAILTATQKQFVEQIFGDMVVEYRENIATSTSPNKKVTINGKTFDWEGGSESAAYEIIYSSPHQIVITRKLPNGAPYVATLNFVDNDTYWIYIGDTPFGSELNIREYFERIK